MNTANAMTVPHHTDALDAVRAVAALVVCLSHGVQIFLLPIVNAGSPLHLLNSLLSETMVIVFFILSGYLISLSIFNNRERSGSFDVIAYARSRLLRIYPPFLFSLALCVLIVVVVGVFDLPGSRTPLHLASETYSTREQIVVTWREVRPALLLDGGFLDINGPLWSLYIEFKLYILAGAVAFALAARTSAGGLVLRIVAAAVVCYWIVKMARASQPGFLWYAAWWLMGAVFFMFRDIRSLLLLLVGAFAVAIVVWSPRGPFIEAARVTFLVAGACYGFYIARSAWRTLVDIASFSYTLYLIHFSMFLLFYSLFVALEPVGLANGVSRVVLFVAALGAVFVLARSMRWLEDTRFVGALLSRPFVRLERQP